MKKLLALTLASTMALTLGACSSSNEGGSATGSSSGDKPYVAIISKGFQQQYWQVVMQGAEDAAKEFNVDITFDGPPTESDINIQVDMLKNVLTKQPDAIALAALDTNSVSEQLIQAQTAGIPVIGFDSGVPGAAEGVIYATAATDSYAAAGIAAQHLYENPEFREKLDTIVPVVGVLTQDATSDSIISRTAGFVDTLVELIEADYGVGTVKVSGHSSYKKDATAEQKCEIVVNVPATTDSANMKAGTEALLATKNISAIYTTNENGASGVLSSTNDGSDFADGGKYEHVIAMGFDAGKLQKNAVANEWFYGSITQNPYQIGYISVKLAVDAINGVPAEQEIIDTGAKWYDSSNMSDPDIDMLVYE